MCFATYSSATAAAYSAGFKASLPGECFAMGGSPSGSRYRGVRITLSDEGSGASVGARVWGMWAAMDRGASPAAGYEAQCIATLTGTSSSGVTIPSGHVRSLAAYGCDTMTGTTTTTATTPKGPGATFNTALGSAGIQVFSPADSATPAFAIIPDCGNPTFIYVETWDAAGNKTNAYIEGIV